jgi:membrane dipeptidase
MPLLLYGLTLLFDQFLNRSRIYPPYPLTQEAREIHQNLFVADLHADSLLWNRDLLRRNNRGHIDLPRLVEGNVGIQIFGVVTQVPWGLNFERNPSDSDMITLLVIAQWWSPKTWGSLLERAIYQAEKLDQFAARSDGQLIFIRSQTDLDTWHARRQAGEPVIGGFPALEGVQALEGRLENLDRLHEAGFRMLGLAHFHDNLFAGSAHGIEQYGLTPFGVELVQQAQAKGMLIDLAHVSHQVIDDVLEITTGPVIVSHTGVRGTCDNQRNLTDDQVRRIAATGGVMGIALFDVAVCGETLSEVAHAIRYVADLVGVDHVALGSDFDGAVTTPIDASGWGLLTQSLLDQGFNEEEIGKIMGENFLRVLQQVLTQ